MALQELEIQTIENNGALLTVGDTQALSFSDFQNSQTGTLAVEDDDDQIDWGSGENATFNGDPATLEAIGTAATGVEVPLLGITLNVSSEVDVAVFSAGGTQYLRYFNEDGSDADPQALLDGFVSDLVGQLEGIPGTGLLGDLTEFVESNLLVNYDLQDSGAMPLCFAAGSLIATPGGEVAVERLNIGDTILTADGHTVPVKWIGRQTFHKFFAGERYSPVRVKAGALGGGLPHCDLTLTADHALMLDGLAINAGALVNGDTIIFVPMSELPDQSTYYHIETEDHDTILANGAEAETFVDYIGRKAFDNYQEYLDLYGAERIIPEMHRPRISTHRLVPQAIRDRLGIAEAGFDLPERLSA